MLHNDILGTPGAGVAFNSLRELPIDGTVWRYQWEGSLVAIETPEGEQHQIPTWTILEISEAEYNEWSQEPGGLIVAAKDVSDYIKEVILKKSAAMKNAAGVA